MLYTTMQQKLVTYDVLGYEWRECCFVNIVITTLLNVQNITVTKIVMHSYQAKVCVGTSSVTFSLIGELN